MTLADLITRVESGSGSDRQLDADICVEINWANTKQKPLIVGHFHEKIVGMIGVLYENGGPISTGDAPPLTSSLDAIRALFKARLEGAWVEITDDSRPRNPCLVSIGSQVGKTLFVEVEHLDTYRAFLSAVLKAIAAKEG